MAEYVLQKLDTEQAQYQVHELACNEARAASETRYIGSYANPQAAFARAVGWHSGVAYCPACLANAH